MSTEAPSIAGAEALRQHGRTFHAAHLLLGRGAAEGVHLLYGFCRHVDDLADELPIDESRVALAGVRRELAGEVPPSPAVAGFRRFLETHPVEPGAAEEFLRGVEQDLDVTRYETEEELFRYCFRVAGTVGLFMCGLFGVRDRRALPFAIDLGIGMQLTNISRDVLEDAGRGRVYLPASLTSGAIDPAELVAREPAAMSASRGAVETLLRRAREHYRSADEGIRFLPARAQLAVQTASRTYEAIGPRVLAAPSGTLPGRVHVNAAGKALHMTRGIASVIGLRARAVLWAVPEHDNRLHDALAGLPGVAG